MSLSTHHDYLLQLPTSRNINFTQCWPQQGTLSSEDLERIEAVRIAFEKRIELG